MKRRLFALLWPLTALLMLGALPWMPEQVGDPGKQASRGFFVGVMLFALANAGLCSAGFVNWLGRAAPGQINIPHREHWLAPERRTATLVSLGEHTSGMGLAMIALLAGVFWRVALPQWQPPVGVWWAGAVALGLYFIAWMWGMYRLFPKPSPDAAPPPLRRPRRPGEPR